MEPPTLAPGQKAVIVVSAAIQPGWHVYGLGQPPGGPTPTIIVLADGPVFSSTGSATGPQPHLAYDPSFQMKTQFYLHAARFTVPLRVASTAAAGRQMARVNIRFQACREDLCLPPATLTLTAPAQIVIPR
ncbi:MAG TPA: protein-disulfide reductase DsbD domain-containing protein [Terriglobales bacterium]|nr:protein-disulfide reductase DsbD domain-containing protein [Terriglobales bacterium]